MSLLVGGAFRRSLARASFLARPLNVARSFSGYAPQKHPVLRKAAKWFLGIATLTGVVVGTNGLWIEPVTKKLVLPHLANTRGIHITYDKMDGSLTSRKGLLLQNVHLIHDYRGLDAKIDYIQLGFSLLKAILGQPAITRLHMFGVRGEVNFERAQPRPPRPSSNIMAKHSRLDMLELRLADVEIDVIPRPRLIPDLSDGNGNGGNGTKHANGHHHPHGTPTAGRPIKVRLKVLESGKNYLAQHHGIHSEAEIIWFLLNSNAQGSINDVPFAMVTTRGPGPFIYCRRQITHFPVGVLLPLVDDKLDPVIYQLFPTVENALLDFDSEVETRRDERARGLVLHRNNNNPAAVKDSSSAEGGGIPFKTDCRYHIKVKKIGVEPLELDVGFEMRNWKSLREFEINEAKLFEEHFFRAIAEKVGPFGALILTRTRQSVDGEMLGARAEIKKEEIKS